MSVVELPPRTTMERPAPASAAQRTALIDRRLDAWLIGGLSLLTFGVMYVAADKETAASQVTWAAFYLAFVVNSPHFIASYWHLYVDGGRKVLTDRRYAWAGIAVPILLIAGLVVASRHRNDSTLGWMVNLMYLSVGWHYVKQIFGVSLVASAAHGKPVTGRAKLAMRVNLLSLWALSWIVVNDYAGTGNFYGVTYKSADVPHWTRPAAYAAVGITLAVAVGMQLVQWVRTGSAMALVGWVAWAAIYVWYLPPLVHKGFGYLIPFFHSLQYLMFSATLSWNKSRAVASDAPRTGPPFALPDAEARLRFARRFGAFVLITFVIGAAGFHWLPEWLDRNHQVRPQALGPTFWIVAFNLFINVHHYFVDNVIWRGTNPDLRAYLRPRPQG